MKKFKLGQISLLEIPSLKEFQAITSTDLSKIFDIHINNKDPSIHLELPNYLTSNLPLEISCLKDFNLWWPHMTIDRSTY